MLKLTSLLCNSFALTALNSLVLFHGMFGTSVSRHELYNNYREVQFCVVTALQDSLLCVVWCYTRYMLKVTIYPSHFWNYKSNVNVPSSSYAFFLTRRYFLGGMQLCLTCVLIIYLYSN